MDGLIFWVGLLLTFGVLFGVPRVFGWILAIIEVLRDPRGKRTGKKHPLLLVIIAFLIAQSLICTVLNALLNAFLSHQ